MPLVEIVCKNCGATMSIDDAREFAFCSYCGSKYLIRDDSKRIRVSGTVEMSRQHEIENLVIRLQEKTDDLLDDTGISAGEFARRASVLNDRYIEKILDMDADNDAARECRGTLAAEATDRRREEEERSRLENERRLKAERRQKRNVATAFFAPVFILSVLLAWWIESSGNDPVTAGDYLVTLFGTFIIVLLIISKVISKMLRR